MLSSCSLEVLQSAGYPKSQSHLTKALYYLLFSCQKIIIDFILKILKMLVICRLFVYSSVPFQ